MMVITKILVCRVTGGVAECGHVVYISRECKMRAPERETKQVPSALLQKFRLKINIAAYGRAASLLVTPGLPHPHDMSSSTHEGEEEVESRGVLKRI